MGFELTLSLIFIFTAFIITQNNAKYVLSGYNTMSVADREKVDIKGYLHFFKRFHIFVGISLFLICTLLRQINDSAAEMFMIIYPIVAYGFLIIRSEKFFNLSGIKKNFGRFMAGFLVLTGMVILYFSLISFKNSELILEKNIVAIQGIYGIKIPKQAIKTITLIEKLPGISIKTNGFQGGTYSKGSFRTKDGRKVKLFVNSNTKHYLLFKTETGVVYYSSDEVDMSALYKKLLAWKG